MQSRKVRYLVGLLILALLGYGIGFGIGKLFDRPSEAQLEAQSQPIPSFQN
jgi:hypothetical protein